MIISNLNGGQKNKYKVSVQDLYDSGAAEIEDVAAKQAIAEFIELKPQERGLVLTLIRELKKLRDEH